MKVHTLYLSLNKRETKIGWLLALLFLPIGILCARMPSILCAAAVLFSVAAVVFLKDFWRESFSNLSLLGRKVWLRPPFAVLANLVLCTFLNDILLFYEVPYFASSGWGPVLWDIRAYILQDSPVFWPLAVVVVLILPVIEEVIFRQVIFTSFYPKSPTIAIILSVVLFTAFHALGYIGMMPTLYLAMFAFQFIPMALFLCWLYLSTDSIVAPILMHMVCNAMVISNAWHYSI